MPVIPAYNTTQYEQVGYALNDARTHLGARVDTLQFISGKMLDFTDSFMQQATNNAWRMMQDCLADLGYSELLNRAIIGSLPVVATVDPEVQVWLAQRGYFDGVQLWTNPALPTDFTHPLYVSERPSGQNAYGWRMEKMVDGITPQAKSVLNRQWEWRQNAIWMPGALQVNDLIIRYVAYLADFIDVSTSRWYQQPLPIFRGSRALGWFIASAIENASVNGDHDLAAAYSQQGESACGTIMNRDVKSDQRVNLRRQSRSGRLEGGNYTGWGNYDCY